MNKTIILNSIWGLIAVGAFLAGRTDQNSNGSGDSASSSGAPASGLSSRSSGAMGSSSSGAYGANGSTTGSLNGSSSSGVTVAQFQSESNALLANKMFADLLLDLNAGNARELFDAMVEKQRNGNDVGQQMGLLLEAWGKVDGPSALAAVSEMGGDGRRRGFASISAMKGWASSDPVAAKAHLEGLEDGFEKGMMTQGVVSGLAEVDPFAATEYVIALDAEREASADGNNDRWRGFAIDRQMEAIANAQIQRGMKDATAWAESLPDGTIKASAFDRVADSFARNDPQEAAEWVKNHAGQEYAERAVREVSEELSREDPVAAVKWAGELPEEAQAGAMSTAMERWTRDDPEAAGSYLTNLADSTTRDAAVMSFARTLDREDPALAAEWAGSITNEATRTETLQSVARSWLRSDADAARAWLPQSGLSAEAQQQAIDESSRGGRPDFRRPMGR